MDAERQLADRNDLIESGLKAARGCWRQFTQKLPPGMPVEYDILYSACLEALVKSAVSFDDTRGSFVPYAWNRMWGAMLDELRGLDWLPRSLRVRIRALERATAKLQRELGREPTVDEVCEAAGIDKAEHHELLQSSRESHVLSIYLTVKKDEDDIRELGDQITAVADPFERFELIDLFRRGWSELSDRERYVLTETIVNERNGSEIASELGITESRVSQIGTAAAKKLRDRAA